MKIYYRESFMTNIYSNPDRNIRMKYYKLTENQVDEDAIDTDSGVLLKNSSPTLGYYEYSCISDPKNIQVSLSPSKSDESVERYRTVFFMYEDIEDNSVGIAFAVSLEPGETLRRVVNLIDIYGFEPQCGVEYLQSRDTQRLEGSGQGRCGNIWTESELESYITLESYRAYNQIYRSTDLTNHVDTVFLNEYGLKIY